MSLHDWLRNSWVVTHEATPEEIAALLEIVKRDLENAAIAGLSADWKLNIVRFKEREILKVICRTWGKGGVLTGFPTFWRLRAAYKTTS